MRRRTFLRAAAAIPVALLSGCAVYDDGYYVGGPGQGNGPTPNNGRSPGQGNRPAPGNGGPGGQGGPGEPPGGPR